MRRAWRIGRGALRDNQPGYQTGAERNDNPRADGRCLAIVRNGINQKIECGNGNGYPDQARRFSFELLAISFQ